MAGARTVKEIKVLIADDHKLVREGLRLMLEGCKDVKIVGEAANGKEAIELALAKKPDVVLMDIEMPLMNGLDATESIKRKMPDCHIFVLTGHKADEYVVEAIRRGASGYALKTLSNEELLDILRRVDKGEAFVQPEATESLLKRMAGFAPDEYAKQELTGREKETLQAMADGLSNKEIAQKFGISLQTVKTHVVRVLRKLQVKDRTEAVAFALRQHLVK